MSTAAPTTPTRTFERRHAYGLVGALVFGWIVVSAGTNVINPLLPLVRAEFHLNGAETGLLTALFTLPYLAMQIPSGILADRLGARRVMVVMMLLAGVTMLATGLWPFGLLALAAVTMLYRAGTGVYYPTAFGVTAGAVPAHRRGTASAFLVMGMALGTALVMALAVPLAEAGGGWRFPLLICGIFTLLLPPIFLLFHWPAAVKSGKPGGTVVGALRDRSLLALFAINFCTNYSFTAAVVWGPSFLSGERGLSLATAGFYISLVNLIGFPAGLASGLLSDRIGRGTMTVLLFVLAAVALAAMGLLHEPSLLLAAVVAYGVAGKWSSDGVLAAWMGDHVAARFSSIASAVFGVNNTARMLGALVAPVITGALLDSTGSLASGLYVAAVVLCLAAGLAPLILDKRAP